MSNSRAQPSIRSFFQPRQPNYTAPPAQVVTRPDPPSPSYANPQLPPKSSKTLPPQVSICSIEEQHIQPLRRINSLLLPIHYPDSFYHKALTPDAPISFSRVITWTDPSTSETKVIGGIVCRVDPALAPDSTSQAPKYQDGICDIYIQSLALLSPYRGKGLVAEILNEVIESATTQQQMRIASLYAHVWTENEEALKWYAARGFKREEHILQGYYRRLKPDTAWIFRRRLNPSDHLQYTVAQLSTPSSIPTIPAAASATLPPPSPGLNPSRPGAPLHARSFQDRGPEREWNDLPDDVLLKVPSLVNSKEGSTASSKSSSRSGTERGRKKRVYPAAAFGS